VVILLMGCSPQRRAQNKLRRAIALDPTIITLDTIRDTIPERRVDTIVSLPFGKPTVITKDGITLTLQPMAPMDVNPIIEIAAETQKEIREIPVERIKYITNPPTMWDNVKDILIWVFLGLLIIVIARALIDKLIK